MAATLDIVIPVYNEGPNILATLDGLRRHVRTPARILICYDHPDDDTLPAIRNNPDRVAGLDITFIRNPGRGAHGAIMAGFAASSAPYVAVFPADDVSNGKIFDAMVVKGQAGAAIVCPSRFMPGGSMVGCPWFKALLVRSAALSLYYVARLPAHDASNGFRLFARRVIEQIEIESDSGFCYSIELLVKCHRLRWPIAEVPAQWIERKAGASRFRVLAWLPAYLRWLRYAFATTLLRRPPGSVAMKSGKEFA